MAGSRTIVIEGLDKILAKMKPELYEPSAKAMLGEIAAAGARDPEQVIQAFGWGLSLSSAIALAAWLGWPLPVQNSGIAGLFLSTEVLAEVAAPVLAWALWSRRWALALVLAVPLALCGSRIAPVAACAGLFAAWRPNSRWTRPALLIALIPVLAALLFAIGPAKASTALSRMVLWGAAVLSIVPEGRGVGWWSVAHPDAYTEFAHSDPLELLVELGAPALWLMAVPGLALLASWHRSGRARALLAALVALIVESLVSFPLKIPAAAFFGAVLTGFLLAVPGAAGRPIGPWLQASRGALLAVAISFVVLNYSAERRFYRLFDGQHRAPEVWYVGARDVLQTFPFERNVRRWALHVMEASAARIRETQK